MQLNNLKTKFLGKNYIYYNSIDSTQSEIWRLYKKNAPNGTLVMAGTQTAGIGTHGKTWHTDELGNIAFSFLIKTNCNIRNINKITTQIAKIITDIFKEVYNIKLQIKEPNDIVYNSKKICGILTETKIVNERVKCLVIGIGININQEKFADDISEIATSIKKEFNIEINIEKFIEIFCEKFEKEIIERIEYK